MRHTPRELRRLDFWPSDPIGFVPFVGEKYEDGIDGVRVLLLGESHYIKPNSDCANAGRGYTQCIFKDSELENKTEKRMRWGSFFAKLDGILTRSESPSGVDAATLWKRVAYANFVQTSVGESARNRPTSTDWAGGRRAFPLLLAKLQPDAILVIGKMTFDRTPDSAGRRIGDLFVPWLKLQRELWEMPHEGGSALMSWVYHPSSWRMETQQSRIAVFEELLRRVARR